MTPIKVQDQHDDVLISEAPAHHRAYDIFVGFDGEDAGEIAEQINDWLVLQAGWYPHKVYLTMTADEGLTFLSALVEFKNEP